MRKPPGNSSSRGFRELPGWQIHPHWEVAPPPPQLHEDRSSSAQDPPRGHPVCVFIWLFICILYHILYGTGDLSVSLSSLSCTNKLIEPEEEVVETSYLLLVGQKQR